MSKPAATAKLLSIPKFARRAGVNQGVVRDAIRNRQLPAIRIGKRDRIPEDAIERLLAAADK